MVGDDRAEFEEMKRAEALALGRDDAVFDLSLRTIRAADKYDYAYLWSWLGVPIIQLPADVMATQEVIWATKPDFIIKTGVARGGSVLFMASILELIGKGEVIGVDIDIRAHNRESIERHPMGKRVKLVEGGSTDPVVLARVRAAIPGDASVMVVLDSDHRRDHVLSRVTVLWSNGHGRLLYRGGGHRSWPSGQRTSAARSRSRTWRRGDEPLAAVQAYLGETDRFEVDEVLNGKLILSSSPGGYLRCRTRA